jgi:hypothetical protein
VGKLCRYEIESGVEKAVANAVANNVGKWAAAIGQKRNDAGFAEFRKHVTGALHAFLLAHIATPGRQRWSTVRKAFVDLSEDYAAMSKLLRHWESGRGLPPIHADPRFKDLPLLTPEPAVLRAALAPYGNASEFAGLAKAAQRYAEACVRDDGGRPPFFAFDVLCVELKKAFERSTRRGARERDGDYFRLVEAVWPVAREVAEAVTKQPLPSDPSTSAALGKRLLRLFPRLKPGTKPSKRS